MPRWKPPTNSPPSARRADLEEEPPILRGDLAVLHADEHLLIVDKPAGMWLGDAPEDEPSVEGRLAALGLLDRHGPPPAAVVPLDMQASGVCVLTPHPDGMAPLREQLAQGAMEIRHLVLVRGRAAAASGTIEQHLAERDGGQTTQVVAEDRGVAAMTLWRLRDQFVGFALLECIPRTAVRQQLRAHLAASGMSPAVDAAYGGGERLMLSSIKANYRPSRRHPELPLIRRLSIHAESVTMTHPATAAVLRFEARMPKDFRAALHQLDKYGRLPTP